MGNLILAAYISLGAATVFIAVLTILMPCIKEVKPKLSTAFTYTVIFIGILFMMYPVLIYSVLIDTKYSIKQTKRSLEKVVLEW